MVWFKVDDRWHSHPKVVGLSLAAAGLWAKAGSWCGEHLTDGAITAAAVRSLGGNAKLARELVEAKLWLPTDDGWRFHEWALHQPSKAYVLEEREKKRKAGKAGASARWEKRSNGHDTSMAPAIGTAAPPHPQPHRSLHAPDPDPDPDPSESQIRTRAREASPPGESEREGEGEAPKDRAGSPPASGPSTDASTESNLAAFVHGGFATRFAKHRAGAAVPQNRANERAFAAVTAWIGSTAAARNEPAEALATRLLDAFFSSKKALESGFLPTWLGQNPLEFIESSSNGSCAHTMSPAPPEAFREDESDYCGPPPELLAALRKVGTGGNGASHRIAATDVQPEPPLEDGAAEPEARPIAEVQQ